MYDDDVRIRPAKSEETDEKIGFYALEEKEGTLWLEHL